MNPVEADITILGNKTFLRCFRKFKNTATNESTGILEYQISDLKVPCLPLSMILLEFYIPLSLKTKGNAGSDNTYSNFIQNFYFPNATIWRKF